MIPKKKESIRTGARNGYLTRQSHCITTRVTVQHQKQQQHQNQKQQKKNKKQKHIRFQQHPNNFNNLVVLTSSLRKDANIALPYWKFNSKYSFSQLSTVWFFGKKSPFKFYE